MQEEIRIVVERNKTLLWVVEGLLHSTPQSSEHAGLLEHLTSNNTCPPWTSRLDEMAKTEKETYGKKMHTTNQAGDVYTVVKEREKGDDDAWLVWYRKGVRVGGE